MRTLIIGLAGQQQARSAREAARTSRPCHRQAVACGEETSISPSQRPPAAIAHTRGLAPGPAGTFGPGHFVRLPGPAGRLAGWSRSPSGTAACPRRAGGSDAWTDGRPCRFARPCPAVPSRLLPRGADPVCIFLFGPYILFGTKGRAQAGVSPCTGQRGGQNLLVSRRDVWSRTCVTRGRDTDGPQHQRHRRQ